MSLAQRILDHPWFSRRSAEYYRWYPKSLALARNYSWAPENAPTIEGAYIHIPYCDHVCGFCPYNKVEGRQNEHETYVDGLMAEIEIYGSLSASRPLNFVYFGGGTPSVLRGDQIGRILDRLARRFGLAGDCEITLEAHPTHISKRALTAWASSGVTRVSSGVQSFDEETLRVLGARHTAADSLSAATALGQSQLRTGIDLLYRVPGQGSKELLSDILRTVSLGGIEHLSLYSLFLQNDEGQPSNYDEIHLSVDAYEALGEAGFQHYASCASGGFDFGRGRTAFSEYELRHWQAPQAAYLGLGAGAIGFVGAQTVNLHSIKRYLQAVIDGVLPVMAVGTVDVMEEQHRYWSLGVKTLSVDLDPFRAKFGFEALQRFLVLSHRLEQEGMVECDVASVRLTDVGRFYVDQISEVFWSPEQFSIAHPETEELRRFEASWSSM